MHGYPLTYIRLLDIYLLLRREFDDDNDKKNNPGQYSFLSARVGRSGHGGVLGAELYITHYEDKSHSSPTAIEEEHGGEQVLSALVSVRIR